MIKNLDYILDTTKKIIYLPPPTGGSRFLMVQARDHIFRKHFGEGYKRIILSGDSWANKIEINEVKQLQAFTVKKMEDK